MLIEIEAAGGAVIFSIRLYRSFIRSFSSSVVNIIAYGGFEWFICCLQGRFCILVAYTYGM